MASQAIGEAKVVTFLGYGFDEINDENLGVAQLIAETKRQNIARAERLKSAPGFITFRREKSSLIRNSQCLKSAVFLSFRRLRLACTNEKLLQLWVEAG